MRLDFSEHPHPPLWEYAAICTRVIDGDTYEVVASLGFHCYKKLRVRLRGLDTPEIRTSNLEEKVAGYRAQHRAIELLLNKPCLLVTHKDPQTFDRWVADVYWYDINGTPISMAETLAAEGYAQ